MPRQKKDVTTSLECYVFTIGKSILEYCNRQRHNKGDGNLALTELEIEEPITLKKISKLEEKLYDYIFKFTSKPYSSSERQNHLLYLLKQYIYFRKGLVNGASLEGEGWRVFADTLIEFVNDCDLLVSNHERTIYIPFHKNIQLNKGDSLTDDGKQARVKLSGLNCLTGYDVFKSSGDLSDILKGNLLSGSSNRIQYIHELIDNHRVLIEHKDNVERDKKLENFEGQIDGFKSLLASLISENKDLRSEVSELSVTLIDALKKLDALKTSQDTLAIIKRPGIFSQILPDEKPTAEIKEQTSLRKHQSTSPV